MNWQKILAKKFGCSERNIRKAAYKLFLRKLHLELPQVELKVTEEDIKQMLKSRGELKEKPRLSIVGSLP